MVDSSAWLEYFADGPNASAFSGAIENPDELAVPTLTLFEVFKKTYQLGGESTALDAVAIMLQGRTVDLSPGLALDAARISLESKLPLADSIILASARSENAILWTQDAHFRGLPNVEFRNRK